MPLPSVFRPLIDFIYPPTCFVCEALLEQKDSRVCPACWLKIRSISAEDTLYQEMLRRLKEGSSTPGETAQPGYVSGLVSLYLFEKEGTLQSIIHQLKYDGMWSLGVELGRRLGLKVGAETGVFIDGIVPVPLHATKRRERGYNQSEYIARGIHEVTGIPVLTSLLKRHKYTSSQTQLTANERMENVGNAFSLTQRGSVHLERKVVLLVDDVITTGATVEACARVLREAGAAAVIAGSVALAVH